MAEGDKVRQDAQVFAPPMLGGSGSRLVGGGIRTTVRTRRLPDLLLDNAKRLHDAGEYAPAIVVAHTAAEVTITRALDALYAHHDAQIVGNAVFGASENQGPMQPRVQRLWKALTGESITGTNGSPWRIVWNAFADSVALRNDIAHQGRMPEAADAAHAIELCEKFAAHIRETLDRHGVRHELLSDLSAEDQ